MDFFIYRLPDTTDIIGYTSRETYAGFMPGAFVVAPFDNNRNNIRSFIPYAPLSVEDLDSVYQESLSEISPNPKYGSPLSGTTRKEHSAMVGRVVEEIMKGNISKCVVSRVINRPGRVNLGETFLNLCAAYPSAMVFCFYSPETGLWLGATPEKLLSCHDGRLTSMALAGTMAVGENAGWDNKNIGEHRIVVSFIEDVLRSVGLDPENFSMETVEAGPVKHLRTRIEAESPPLTASRLADLTERLSPTPALSGFPRDNAMRLIGEIEKHERGYYGGYFGFYRNEKDFDFFVNLRSMLVEPDSFHIFAGGGIMEESRAEDEWEETERKAGTLLSRLALQGKVE